MSARRRNKAIRRRQWATELRVAAGLKRLGIEAQPWQVEYLAAHAQVENLRHQLLNTPVHRRRTHR